MNYKAIFAIIIFIGAIIASSPVGENFSIVVYDLGVDSNGYQVNGQCQNNGDGTFTIVIDDSQINNPNLPRILLHELGHVQHWDDWEEADCDNYANSFNLPGVDFIQDAYNGIH